MVEDRFQNVILAAIDKNITPRVELAVRSINASSGRNAAIVTPILENGEGIGITALFENVSGRTTQYMNKKRKRWHSRKYPRRGN